MKKLILLFGIFISTLTTNAFGQEDHVQSMRFIHDFTVTGLKSEKQAQWIDSVMTSLPQVFSCTTDFKIQHTNIVVHEAFNSPVLIQNIFVKLGFGIDQTSYASKLEQ